MAKQDRQTKQRGEGEPKQGEGRVVNLGSVMGAKYYISAVLKSFTKKVLWET